jgi:hypothetical protein
MAGKINCMTELVKVIRDNSCLLANAEPKVNMKIASHINLMRKLIEESLGYRLLRQHTLFVTGLLK